MHVSVRVVRLMASVNFKRNRGVSTHSVQNPNIKLFYNPPGIIILLKK
jgi:hypothetical protein